MANVNNNFQANYTKLQNECSSLRALIATKDKPKPPPSGPSPNKPGDPEVVELDGTTWKWCAKCFNGAWTKTHIMAEHVRGRGRQQQCQTPPDANDNNNPGTPTPQANLSTASSNLTYSQVLQANTSAPTSYEMDFM
jgi:hypothetical protein